MWLAADGLRGIRRSLGGKGGHEIASRFVQSYLIRNVFSISKIRRWTGPVAKTTQRRRGRAKMMDVLSERKRWSKVEFQVPRKAPKATYCVSDGSACGGRKMAVLRHVHMVGIFLEVPRSVNIT